MNMDPDIIGFVGMTLSTTQLIPEIVLALRTHRLDDVSWLTLVLMISGSLAWGLYGYMLSSTPMIITNIVFVSSSLTLVFLKQHYHKSGLPLKPKKELVSINKTQKK